MAGGSGETLVMSRLTGGKRRLESAADPPFTGLLVRAPTHTDAGCVVFDVCESRRRCRRIRRGSANDPEQAGINEPPRFHAPHTVIER